MVVPILLRHRTWPRRLRRYRHDFSKLIWQLASPKWDFDDATFERSAAAFDNPDHVAIVVHNYRWRLDLAEGESKYDDLEKLTRKNSRANTSTGPSRGALAIICRRRRRRPSPKRLSMSVQAEQPRNQVWRRVPVANAANKASQCSHSGQWQGCNSTDNSTGCL